MTLQSNVNCCNCLGFASQVATLTRERDEANAKLAAANVWREKSEASLAAARAECERLKQAARDHLEICTSSATRQADLVAALAGGKL